MRTVLCVCVLFCNVAFSWNPVSPKQFPGLSPYHHQGQGNKKNKGSTGVTTTKPISLTTSPLQTPDPTLSFVVNGHKLPDTPLKHAGLQHGQLNYTEGDHIMVKCSSKIHQIYWEARPSLCPTYKWKSFDGTVLIEDFTENNVITPDYPLIWGSDIPSTCKDAGLYKAMLIKIKVPVIGLRSSGKNRSEIDLKLDRFDDNLKILCNTSTKVAAVTFLWNNIEGKMDNETALKLSYIEENSYITTDNKDQCVLIYPNSTKQSLEQGSKIHFVREHNHSLMFCAEFVSSKHSDVTELKLNKTKIIIQQDVSKLQENGAAELKGDISQLDEARGMEAFIPLIAGAVAIVVIMVAVIIACTCYCRRKHQELDEDIYSDPNHLEYAEIKFNGHGPLPIIKNEPYAKIIGVVKKKRNNKPAPPHNSMRRNQKVNRNDENGYAEIHLLR